MIKYAKVINEQTGLVDVGVGTNVNFYQSIGMIELDVQQSDIDNNWYLAEKCPMKTDEEKEAEEIEKQINKINEELSELDMKRIRAICEPEIKDEETGETWLDYYNAEVLKLREELNSL